MSVRFPRSPRRPGPLRRTVLVALAAVALLLAPLGTSVAQAEDGYRYWGYYQLADGEWQFATAAPGDMAVADGAVEGWRYAVSGMASTRPPRATPTFEEVCSKVRPVDGQKRVAVVVDPGTTEDAPQDATAGELTATCVVAPTAATGMQVLQTATAVRTDDSGMVCGIGGYPATGCADPVANVTIPTQDAAVTPQLAEPAGDVSASTPGWVWGTVGGLVVVLAGTGIIVARRRRA